MPTKPGLYIVIEGSDGVGKTTQLELLKKRLEASGLHVSGLREPAGDAVGRIIRKILADPAYDIDPRTEVLLFNAARSGLMRKVKELTGNGTWCVADRSFLSTLAYQCYGHAGVLDIASVQNICDFAIADRRPDLIIVLDAPAQELAKRREKLAMNDRIDMFSLDFFERVRQGYLAEARRLELPVINGLLSVGDIEQQIWKLVEPLVKGVT